MAAQAWEVPRPTAGVRPLTRNADITSHVEPIQTIDERRTTHRGAEAPVGFTATMVLLDASGLSMLGRSQRYSFGTCYQPVCVSKCSGDAATD